MENYKEIYSILLKEDNKSLIEFKKNIKKYPNLISQNEYELFYHCLWYGSNKMLDIILDNFHTELFNLKKIDNELSELELFNPLRYNQMLIKVKSYRTFQMFSTSLCV